MPKLRVSVCSYNGSLDASVDALNPPLSDWLLPGSDPVAGAAPPDLVAVGFQEMIPLHRALIGYSSSALDHHDRRIQRCLEANATANAATIRRRRSDPAPDTNSYTLLSKACLGGIVLFVYARDATLTPRIAQVQVATAAVGIAGLMGNKGGVGVRIVLEDRSAAVDDDDDSELDEPDVEGEANNSVIVPDQTVFTFVTAHLAAHDHGLGRRNRDYRSIVERLIFTEGAVSPYFRSRKAIPATAGNVHGSQIYDTSYLFFFGDLNYRLSIKEPKTLPLHIINHKLINDLAGLLAHDTLAIEQSKGNTLLGLREGPIDFPPTYKYKPGTRDTFKKFSKRVPGWCDRVLFSTWADGVEGAGKVKVKSKRAGGQMVEKRRKGARVENYSSVMAYMGSDHKPVTCVISLPRHPKRSTAPLRLPMHSPFLIDQTWRRKQAIGGVLDKIVGFGWCIVMLVGIGNLKLGFANILLILVSSWYLGYIQI